MRWALVVVLAACNYPLGTLPPLDSGRINDGPDSSLETSDGGGLVYVANTVGKAANMAIVKVTVTGMPNATYVVGIATKPYVTTGSVLGLGAQWMKIADQCGARSQTGMAMYVGRGANASGDITITLDATTIAVVAEVGIYTGSTSDGATASYNAVSVNTCNEPSMSVDVSSYSFPIAATGGRVVGMIATRARTHTPGPGLTQRAQQFQGSGGDVAGVALVDGDVTTVAGTFDSSTDVAAVAIELR